MEISSMLWHFFFFLVSPEIVLVVDVALTSRVIDVTINETDIVISLKSRLRVFID